MDTSGPERVVWDGRLPKASWKISIDSIDFSEPGPVIKCRR